MFLILDEQSEKCQKSLLQNNDIKAKRAETGFTGEIQCNLFYPTLLLIFIMFSNQQDYTELFRHKSDFKTLSRLCQRLRKLTGGAVIIHYFSLQLDKG